MLHDKQIRWVAGRAPALLVLCLALRANADVIRSLAVIHRMPVEQAKKGLAVFAEGVVTDTSGWPYGLTVQDENEGLYVGLAPGAPHVEVGQRIVVQGTTNEGRFAPIIQAAKIDLKGRHQLPVPYPARARELASGVLDNRLVEVRGVVRATATGNMGDGSGVYMVVDLNPGLVHVAVARSIHLDVTRFVDATVRASGVVGVEFNDRRQALGASVMVNRIEDISVLHEASGNPLDQEAVPIGDIFRWGVDRDWSHRIKVNGVLTLQRPGEFFVLQDGNQAIRVESLDAQPLTPGVRMDAAGFAIPADSGPMLADAVTGKRGKEQTVQPLARKAAAMQPGDDSWLLVKLQGRLIESHESGTGLSLSLEDEGHRFVADAPAAAARELARLTPGSRLEVTGINEIQVDALRRPKGFRLLIRSAEDVTVLSAGPWLKGAEVLWSALALGAIALLCGLWALALRSRVRSQTAWIAERLENEKASAWIHAERGRILGLISRNASLQQVCEAVLTVISAGWPGTKATIGIESGGEREWIGQSFAEPAGEQLELASSSGAIQARVLISRAATQRERDLLDLCRESLSIALEHRELHERLVRQSLSDPLTALPNRRALDAHLDRVLQTAREKRSQAAIVVIDMDEFKGINDTLGHAAGDIVLTTLARRFSSVIRRTDLMARIGGDEFVGVLENVAGEAEATELALRLRDEASKPIEISGVEICPSLSFGIALFPDDGRTAQSLKDTADTRMYRSKMGRGNMSEPAGELALTGAPGSRRSS